MEVPKNQFNKNEVKNIFKQIIPESFYSEKLYVWSLSLPFKWITSSFNINPWKRVLNIEFLNKNNPSQYQIWSLSSKLTELWFETDYSAILNKLSINIYNSDDFLDKLVDIVWIFYDHTDLEFNTGIIDYIKPDITPSHDRVMEIKVTHTHDSGSDSDIEKLIKENNSRPTWENENFKQKTYNKFDEIETVKFLKESVNYDLYDLIYDHMQHLSLSGKQYDKFFEQLKNPTNIDKKSVTKISDIFNILDSLHHS